MSSVVRMLRYTQGFHSRPYPRYIWCSRQSPPWNEGLIVEIKPRWRWLRSRSPSTTLFHWSSLQIIIIINRYIIITQSRLESTPLPLIFEEKGAKSFLTPPILNYRFYSSSLTPPGEEEICILRWRVYWLPYIAAWLTAALKMLPPFSMCIIGLALL